MIKKECHFYYIYYIFNFLLLCLHLLITSLVRIRDLHVRDEDFKNVHCIDWSWAWLSLRYEWYDFIWKSSAERQRWSWSFDNICTHTAIVRCRQPLTIRAIIVSRPSSARLYNIFSTHSAVATTFETGLLRIFLHAPSIDTKYLSKPDKTVLTTRNNLCPCFLIFI